MSRHPEPWYREEKDAWFVTLNGKQKRLAKGRANKQAAYDAYHALMASDGQLPPSKDVTLGELVAKFRVWSASEHAESTQVWYESHLTPLLAYKNFSRKKASELTPSDVSNWVASRKVRQPTKGKGRGVRADSGKPLGQSTKRGAITVVKSLFSFAEKNCGVRNDTMKHLERPAMKRRRAATLDERERIYDEVKDCEFREFLTVVMESGCRPGEAMRLTAEMVKLGEGVIVFEGKTTGVTGNERVIYMTDRLREVLARLVTLRPESELLRNTDGNPWTVNAVRCRFRRLRAKLGLKGVVCYSLRHAFVTDGLEAGVPIAQMAELAGHSDTKMISQVYSHLKERREHMREMAEKATKR